MYVCNYCFLLFFARLLQGGTWLSFQLHRLLDFIYVGRVRKNINLSKRKLCFETLVHALLELLMEMLTLWKFFQ
jgi:hypothetical protein